MNDGANKMNTADKQQAAVSLLSERLHAGSEPRTTEQPLCRTVMAGGKVQRSSFELAPSHARLAESIEALNGETATGGPAPRSRHPDANATLPTVSREQVLPVMGRHPEGLAALDICVELVARKDTVLVHRIAAILAREVKRGLVEPSADKRNGAKRVLTEAGKAAAAQIAIEATRERNEIRKAAKVVGKSAKLGQRVNGVFDYARKVQFGLC